MYKFIDKTKRKYIIYASFFESVKRGDWRKAGMKYSLFIVGEKRTIDEI